MSQKSSYHIITKFNSFRKATRENSVVIKIINRCVQKITVFVYILSKEFQVRSMEYFLRNNIQYFRIIAGKKR